LKTLHLCFKGINLRFQFADLTSTIFLPFTTNYLEAGPFYNKEWEKLLNNVLDTVYKDDYTGQIQKVFDGKRVRGVGGHAQSTILFNQSRDSLLAFSLGSCPKRQ
jgi:hypothetical protein